MFLYKGTVTVEESHFRNNRGSEAGGAIFIDQVSAAAVERVAGASGIACVVGVCKSCVNSSALWRGRSTSLVHPHCIFTIANHCLAYDI